VVATTSIVGDVVRQIGGEGVQVTVLLPVGADPHAFEPSPQDVARVAEADVIFAVGAGLEVFLEPLLKNAGGKACMWSWRKGSRCGPSRRSPALTRKRERDPITATRMKGRGIRTSGWIPSM
jgi:hypothetical protein